MRPVARANADTVVGGGLMTFGSTNVFVNTIPAVLFGSPITPHGCCGSPGCEIHCSSTIVGGSTNVFVNNIPSVRLGDPSVCGDPVITGSPNVFFG
jgi:uncharacterized Zn-binding protein involved in type VI secretion